MNNHTAIHDDLADWFRPDWCHRVELADEITALAARLAR